MQVAHTYNRFHFEQAQKFSDTVVSVKRDLLTEVNQQRLIARALESRGIGGRFEHAAKLYCRTTVARVQVANPFEDDVKNAHWLAPHSA